MPSKETLLLNSAQLIRCDATQLQKALQAGTLTSVQLIRAVLAQIEREDQNGLGLKAMLALTPLNQLIESAETLDKERKAGKIRGPLHGIPIIIKDCIATDPDLGLPTSVGNLALLHSKPKKSASIINKLLEAGLIVLGKANLTEFCSMKADKLSCGWSPVGGQTRSAYVAPTDNPYAQTWTDPASPGGSSTGSAVGVSAGYAPVAIGSETYESIIQPASRAGLYALKPTIGNIAKDGTWLISSTADSLGPMAKSVTDLVALYEAIAEKNGSSNVALPFKNFSELKVGFLDPDIWQWPDAPLPFLPAIRAQVKKEFLAAMTLLKAHIAKVVPVALPALEDLVIDNEVATATVFYYEYGKNINHYLQNLAVSDVRDLQELVDWNQKYAKLELPKAYPDQNRLLRALHHPPSLKEYERAKYHMRDLYRTNGIDKVLEEQAVDIIAVPDTSKICQVASASGYPIATVPLSTLKYNGMPFGISIMTKAHHEPYLFELMKGCERIFPKRALPTRLDK